MIAQISGNMIRRATDHLVVDVGGVGYRLFVSLNTFYALPEPPAAVDLCVHTVVRDDAIHLYGFGDEAEKLAFGHLIGVNGVGPKLAMSILSGIGPDDLWQAVRGRDTARLCKVPGIGKKTAARMIVDLEGKLPAANDDAVAASPATAFGRSAAADDALSALMNLGYPEARAAKAVDAAAEKMGAAAPVEDLLREVLKSLG